MFSFIKKLDRHDKQALFTKELLIDIVSFGDTVGIKIYLIALLQLKLLLFVTNAFHTCKHEIGFAFKVFYRRIS